MKTIQLTHQAPLARASLILAFAVLALVLLGPGPARGTTSSSLDRAKAYHIPFANRAYDLLYDLHTERTILETYFLTLNPSDLNGLNTVRGDIGTRAAQLLQLTTATAQAEPTDFRRKRLAATATSIQELAADTQQLDRTTDSLIEALKRKDMKNAAPLVTIVDQGFESIESRWRRLIGNAIEESSHRRIADELDVAYRANELALIALSIEFRLVRFRRAPTRETRKQVLDLVSAGDKHVKEIDTAFSKGLGDRRTERRSHRTEVLDARQDLKGRWSGSAKAIKRYVNTNDARQRNTPRALADLQFAILVAREETEAFAAKAEAMLVAVLD